MPGRATAPPSAREAKAGQHGLNVDTAPVCPIHY